MTALSRLVITTGGTGGHVFPALAVAEEIRHRNPDARILFLGGSGPEGDMARTRGLEFRELPAKGIMGRGLKGMVQGMGWVGRGVCLARRELRRFQPDAVIGFGGYAGFCPVLAARIASIPCAVHEQNSMPGAANRMLGNFANTIFISFGNVHGAFPEAKIRLTGNPVRRDIAETGALRAERQRGRHVLVLGGSQGAHPLNTTVIQALPDLMAAGITLTHQTGPADLEQVRQAYREAGADPEQVRDFIEDMAFEYARADLAVCRAGATTVFEVAAAGVPAIFVPFPQATHDHQTLNAKALADRGAARLLPQSELDPGLLARDVAELLRDPEQLKGMETAALGFARPDAASRIADGLEALCAKVA
ncbi:undecaprenyldiphospho-muramoylpentapeptide beta-N-acetylglucosaminyltransferase [Pseudodesulfovibrio tunisiensis]|uniref:undecaprenyldiphospho-muramoylpentapeptide beta-N-acetylglucosaminyltransferase n=1 Tax=Pseudodesulfovibrio tunisiensis TaxID=463192 RepID=UPI001FB31042|nr:undecaprenyldiphospho-muramoylpentapeptide beta-N-acetylglucosaminyltransferase [Pseudodesulfovibrio tunisiensis]